MIIIQSDKVLTKQAFEEEHARLVEMKKTGVILLQKYLYLVDITDDDDVELEHPHGDDENECQHR